MSDKTKYYGWGALALAGLWFYESQKENNPINIDGLDVNVDAERLINSGVNKLNISEDNKENLRRVANNALGRYLANGERYD